MLESRGPKPARQWLDDNPSHVARGLVSLAAGRGKLAEAAIEQLRALKRRDENAAAAIEAAAQTLPEAEAARVQSAVVDYQENSTRRFPRLTRPTRLSRRLQAIRS